MYLGVDIKEEKKGGPEGGRGTPLPRDALVLSRQKKHEDAICIKRGKICTWVSEVLCLCPGQPITITKVQIFKLQTYKMLLPLQLA